MAQAIHQARADCRVITQMETAHFKAGLRRGEVEDLRLEDLDRQGRKISVRRGKGPLDRTVFLTATVVGALQAYLAVRGPGPTDHVLLYRNQALSKDLIHGRLKACGARVKAPVGIHRRLHPRLPFHSTKYYHSVGRYTYL